MTWDARIAGCVLLAPLHRGFDRLWQRSPSFTALQARFGRRGSSLWAAGLGGKRSFDDVRAERPPTAFVSDCQR
jgi:hypothetical protein